MPKCILLDIEGTTTPISWVYETLFPFARAHLREFLESNLQEDLQRLEDEYNADNDPEKPEWNAEQYLTWLLDRDRKSTALKSIQGKIWEKGFANGELKGEVFPDVPPALQRWTDEGKKIYIFSSGSVLAQKLVFANTKYGDLTQYLSGFFDTETGPKREPESYNTIAKKIGIASKDILFLSDVPEELIAAQEARFVITLVVRPGNKPVHGNPDRSVLSFDGL